MKYQRKKQQDLFSAAENPSLMYSGKVITSITNKGEKSQPLKRQKTLEPKKTGMKETTLHREKEATLNNSESSPLLRTSIITRRESNAVKIGAATQQ